VTVVENVTTAVAPSVLAPDHRDSWIPTYRMISTRLAELRGRRGLMITIAVVVIGIPSVFLGIRLIMHAADPKTYAPAGGSDIFTALVAGILYVFGFVVAALLGCTAGSSDLTDGMFRHAVVTGRSRLALYLARIPAGLAIVVSMVGVGFAIVCIVCTVAAPTSVSYDGVNVPPNLTRSEFVAWSVANADVVVCSFNYTGSNGLAVPCGPNGRVSQLLGVPKSAMPSQARIEAFARTMAVQNYASYSQVFLAPSVTLMVESGMWLLLEATIGFIVGLGLGSLLGQRTVAVILMIVLEVILTPIMMQARVPYLINVQRAVVGIATAHLEPKGLSHVFGAGGGPNGRAMLIPETTTVAVIVIIAWLVGWTALGAWRMMTRDA
jgi:hypothetical protein